MKFIVFFVEAVNFPMEFLIPLGAGDDKDENQLYDIAERQQEHEWEGVQLQPEPEHRDPEELKKYGSGHRFVRGDGLADGLTEIADHGHLQASVGRPHQSQ